MSISLTHEQQAALSAYVAQGDFSSVEDAARQLIDERIASRAAEQADDLVWAKPYVDEAVANVARGKLITRQEHEARMDAQIESMQRE